MAHVLSRGNARATVFHSPSEYDDFIRLMDEARSRHPVDLLAFCVMPNHFHLVVNVDDSERLSAFMQWWLTSHVRRHHRRHASSGHVWQGRFKSFPIQADEHLLTVLRYVLLNPCRAQLTESPWAWRWSSLMYPEMMSAWPVPTPLNLGEWLMAPSDPDAEEELRNSIRRGTPYGDAKWRVGAAIDWGLESTLRRPGRPNVELSGEGASRLDLGV